MKTARLLFCTFTAGLFLTGAIYARQDTTAALTLRQAVALALEQNQEIINARLEIDRADAQVSEAWGYALPALDFTGRYTRALKKPVFFLPAEFGGGKPGDPPLTVRVGSDHSIDLGFTGRQTLFNATVITGVGASRIYARAARELFAAKRLEVVTNVRKAYYRVLLAAEAKRMMRENLANAEENLRNVRILAGQGLVSEYDELRAAVGAENLKPVVIQAENNFALALDGLRIAIGADHQRPIAVSDSLSFQPISEDVLMTAPERAVESNLNLRALRLQVDIQGAFVSVERSNYLPSLSAFGNYQYQLAKNSLRFSPSELIASSQVGLVLSMNVFQGFQTNARVEQAKVNLRKTEEQVVSLERNLRTAASSVVLRLREADQRFKSQERTVEQAERGYRIATARFLSGSGTQLEVNDAQLALTQARVNRMQAIYDYVEASADLDVAIGRFPAYVSAEHDED